MFIKEIKKLGETNSKLSFLIIGDFNVKLCTKYNIEENQIGNLKYGEKTATLPLTLITE